MKKAECIELADVDIKHEFTKGLNIICDTIKAPADVGKFLLLLANVYVDKKLQTVFQRKLNAICALLSQETIALLADGRATGMMPDDLLVFLQANCVGIDNLKPFVRKRVGPWDLQFNHLRCFRPRRAAGDVPKGTIHLEFDNNGFHFNKPFLKDECFARCTFQGKGIYWLYNKFPFHEGHALIVLAPEKNYEQYLTEPCLRLGWSIAEMLKERYDMRLGYNSIGAYASVNHLHFQAIIGRLPVEDACWKHNGGRVEYPALCDVFTDADKIWNWIADKQGKSIAYNLLLSGGKAYCFARRHQANYRHSEWTSGFAWYELSGSFIMFNQNDYQALDTGKIGEEMRLIQINDM